VAVSRGSSLQVDDARPGFDPDARLATLADDVRDAVRRRSISVHARLRVADAIYALALDIVGGDSLSPEDQLWLRQRIAGPVTEATEEALSVLTQELSEALRAAPPRMRPSIFAAHTISRTDFE
jgi:hypothetical protein